MGAVPRPDPRLRELETLTAVHDALSREPNLAGALQTALEKLVDLVDVSTGWLFTTTLREGDVHESGFLLSASTGLPKALASSDRQALRCAGCECQTLFRKGRLDHGINMVTCSRLAEAEGDRGGLEIHASVPLLAPSGPVGILNLAAPGDRRFDQETLTFLSAIGKALGTAVERNRLQEERMQEARYAAALEERQRLARDMHDALSQLLFAADLSVGAARQGVDPERRALALDEAAAILADAQAELRGLVEVLRAPDVSCGLASALRRLAQRTDRHVEVQLDVEGVDDVELAPRVAEALYRIAQEALHNALRHARPSRVGIRLAAAGDRLQLEIADDGAGFEPRPSAGLGIPGMRERAAEIGAEFTLVTAPSEGTRVRVSLSSEARR